MGLSSGQVATPQMIPQRHATADEYARFLARLDQTSQHKRYMRMYRRKFVERYPTLGAWFAAPLTDRVGRLRGESRHATTNPISYKAHCYLLFLGLGGYAALDYDWLLARPNLRTKDVADQLGLDYRQQLEGLVTLATSLGHNGAVARVAMRWAVSRLILHRGNPSIEAIRSEHLDELKEAIHAFSERGDLPLFHGSWRVQALSSAVHKLKVVLYHRGQINEQPKKVSRTWALRPSRPSRMEAVVSRYLAAKALTDRPATVARADHTLRKFMGWLNDAAPEIVNFANVTRDHALGFIADMVDARSQWSGQPLALNTRINRIHALGKFFEDTAVWQWDDVPGRKLLGAGDAPKYPVRVPRYIPAAELERLLVKIRDLQCPYQRTALIVARWSGARRGEINRLDIDCLDRYPDGTARLRLPAGKTFRERTIPLHEEAAAALEGLLAMRDVSDERAFIDEASGAPTRYLFLRRGKLLSEYYLFDTPLRVTCKQAGLVDAHGNATVTAHRFRHTVGTQLAERGAKLRTIMSVLGHESAAMSLVYASISDPEVLRDYRSVLGPGANIAGPSADAVRMGTISPAAVDWLKTNFFKTELELGHCLRLPEEGPCECDLYLTCAKFVTTAAYAPRLRRRRRVELDLAEDAVNRGWEREVERHRCTADRLQSLLADLGEALDGPEAVDVKPEPSR